MRVVTTFSPIGWWFIKEEDSDSPWFVEDLIGQSWKSFRMDMVIIEFQDRLLEDLSMFRLLRN